MDAGVGRTVRRAVHMDVGISDVLPRDHAGYVPFVTWTAA
jgi:hypothetical protein